MLEPKLADKIHIYTGRTDTFFLEGAVKLLKQEMESLHAKCVIELFPGNHFTVLTQQLRDRIDREMAAQFKAAHQNGGAS